MEEITVCLKVKFDTGFREYQGADAMHICIDGGMTRQMIYHGDHHWSLELEKE